MKRLFSNLQPPWRRKRRRVLSSSARRRADKTVEGAPPWWLRIRPARAGLGVGTAVLLSLLLCIHLWPNRVSLREGDTADRDIIAPRTVRYEDTLEARQQRDDAIAQVPEQFDYQPSAAADAQYKVREIYSALERRVRPKGGADAASLDPDPARVATEIRQDLGIGGLRAPLKLLMRQTPQARLEARRVSLALVERAMARQITNRNNSLAQAREALSLDETLQRLPTPLRPAALAVAEAALVPNYTFNGVRTQQAREAAAKAIDPQVRRLVTGSVVIRKGERVTRQHIDKVRALGLQNPRLDAATVMVVCVLVALLVTLTAVYLALFHRTLYQDTPRLFLLALLSLISVVGIKVGSTLLGLPFSGVHFGYLGMMCVASAGMAIALLLSPGVATLIVALLSVASGLLLNNELRFTVITLGSSLVGIVSVATLRNRGDLLRATMYLCGANALLIVLIGQIEGDTGGELMSGALWGVISGLFALVLFWMGVAVFERPFGITTHLRLLELSDPATPILQEFRMRVPGTYAHSLMVGNLAHAAAEAIGADGLLVRVAAYYHDLGKMSRPQFFIENQANAENIHDRLSPSMSALVLTSHVKEGLEIAEEVGLPPHVRDVIRQHHGTSLMKYFYHRATGGVHDPTLEAQFRYAGPKPQTKEAAILMLADSVEAASRTLDKPTPARIADFVRGMVEDKRADGQLDDCDLTLRDLKQIQDVFTRLLSATLHARIEYPSASAAPRPLSVKPAPAPLAAAALATFPEEALTGALTATVEIPAAGGLLKESTTHGNDGSNGRGSGSGGGDGTASAYSGPDNGRKTGSRSR